MAGRFIKVYEKLLKWEWFTDANTLQLFIYLLLSANYKELTFHGEKIQRGQLVTSLTKLGQATGQTIRQVRDNLKHLEMTGEVTSRANNRYRVITIVRYDDYQSSDKQNDKQIDKQLDKQMTSQPTSKTTTSIEYIESNNDRYIESPSEIYKGKTAQRFIPPTKQEIDIFCLENGLSIDVDYFYDHYTSNGWMIGKNKMKDWRATVRNWARRDRGSGSAPVPVPKPKPSPVKPSSAHNFNERDYSSVPDQQMDDLEAWVAREREAGNL